MADKGHFSYGYAISRTGRYVTDYITLYKTRNEVRGGWQLILLEAFLTDRSVLELDVVCQTHKDRFVAVYNGHNVHYFNIPVIGGHTYQREILFDKSIKYILHDVNTSKQESYELPIITSDLRRVFRGAEWHAGPVPLRYEVVIDYPDKGKLINEQVKGVQYPIEVDNKPGRMTIKNKQIPIYAAVMVIAVLLLSLKLLDGNLHLFNSRRVSR